MVRQTVARESQFYRTALRHGLVTPASLVTGGGLPMSVALLPHRDRSASATQGHHHVDQTSFIERCCARAVGRYRRCRHRTGTRANCRADASRQRGYVRECRSSPSQHAAQHGARCLWRLSRRCRCRADTDMGWLRVWRWRQFAQSDLVARRVDRTTRH